MEYSPLCHAKVLSYTTLLVQMKEVGDEIDLFSITKNVTTHSYEEALHYSAKHADTFYEDEAFYVCLTSSGFADYVVGDIRHTHSYLTTC